MWRGHTQRISLPWNCHLSKEKKPACLVYSWDYATQFCRDYNTPGSQDPHELPINQHVFFYHVANFHLVMKKTQPSSFQATWLWRPSSNLASSHLPVQRLGHSGHSSHSTTRGAAGTHFGGNSAHGRRWGKFSTPTWMRICFEMSLLNMFVFR